MKKTHTVRIFVTGFLAALVLVGAVPSTLAAAAGKNITVYPGISIYIDDQKLNPTDANGKPVEVFTYNGTTYLPVRAVSEALGQPIQWDGSSRSVYVGKHNSTTPAAWLSQMEYFSGTQSVNTAASQNDNAGNTHYHCFTSRFNRTYLLNGQYSRLTGTLYQPYEWRSSTVYSRTGVTIYGDGEILYDNRATDHMQHGGFVPASFDIDLTGVLNLQVVLDSPINGDIPLALGDVGLWT